MISNLECAAAPQSVRIRVSAIDTPPSLGSLARNQLCRLDDLGYGTYTAEGITKLCEALKGSAVTSLKCAPPRVFAFASAPLDTPDVSPSPPCPLLAV